MIDDYFADLEIAYIGENPRKYIDSIIRTSIKESIKYKFKIKQKQKVYWSLADHT